MTGFSYGRMQRSKMARRFSFLGVKRRVTPASPFACGPISCAPTESHTDGTLMIRSITLITITYILHVIVAHRGSNAAPHCRPGSVLWCFFNSLCMDGSQDCTMACVALRTQALFQWSRQHLRAHDAFEGDYDDSKKTARDSIF